MDNEDLKFININPWDIPKLYPNSAVRAVLEQILKMEPGEVVLWKGTVVDGRLIETTTEEVRLLRSAVWRQIQRHELGAAVIVRGGKMYLKKQGAN